MESKRVLIIDDSPFVREILREGLSQCAGIEVVGEASDGRQGQRLVAECRPDVVTMDVVMPMVGGIEAIRGIMASTPTPIVVVADERSGVSRVAHDAIEAGAVDVFPKPRAGFDDKAAQALGELLRNASRVRAPRRHGDVAPVRARNLLALRARLKHAAFLGIVASTGGPQTLRAILGHLPADFPVPIAIAQHTARGFTEGFAAWLDASVPLHVTIGQGGQRVERGEVVLAPDDVHLDIDSHRMVRLLADPPVKGHRPSGTVLLRSLATAFGKRAIGVVLTGMGDDGAAGLVEIGRRGGLAVVEDPRCAILAGMPLAAMAQAPGAVVGTADEIGAALRSGAERDA
jgi:two-component system chemotaxis response regulator CheB